MNAHTVVTLLHDAKCLQWVNLMVGKEQELAAWLASLHPQKGVTCKVDQGCVSGGFNFGKKATFSDGTKWLLRFPKQGHVSAAHADEKVAIEARVLRLLAEKTTIPVPKVWHWGRAADCPLGLGPFIIMDFIEGVPLGTLLQSPEAAFRRIKDNFPEDKIEQLYGQLARILLQLFHFDVGVDCIRNLPAAEGSGFQVPVRPLTFKAHDILQDGGIDTFQDGVSNTTIEYFGRVFEQDWEQLLRQQNSASGEYDAKNKYLALSVVRSLFPGFVHPEYDAGPFRLLCDDICPWNLIVRSAEDLTVVAVVDLEWSYVGPAQLLATAPWWLLGIRLTNVDTYYDEDHPEMAARYVRHLQLFKRALAEEEAKLESSYSGEFSRLVEWSETSGAMWLHMLLLSGFNHPENLPFVKLQQHVGPERWKEVKNKLWDANAEAFGKAKAVEAEKYNKAEEEAQKLKEQLDRGALTPEHYTSALASLLPQNVDPLSEESI